MILFIIIIQCMFCVAITIALSPCNADAPTESIARASRLRVRCSSNIRSATLVLSSRFPYLAPNSTSARATTFAFIQAESQLYVLDTRLCNTIDRIDNVGHMTMASVLVDIDGDGVKEVVASQATRGLRAYRWNVTRSRFDLLWSSSNDTLAIETSTGGGNSRMDGLEAAWLPWAGGGKRLYILSAGQAFDALTGACVNCHQYNMYYMDNNRDLPFYRNTLMMLADADDDGATDLLGIDGVYTWLPLSLQWNRTYTLDINDNQPSFLRQGAMIDVGVVDEATGAADVGARDRRREVLILGYYPRIVSLNGTVVSRAPNGVLGNGIGGPAVFDDGRTTMAVMGTDRMTLLEISSTNASSLFSFNLSIQDSNSGRTTATSALLGDLVDANGIHQRQITGILVQDACYVRVIDFATRKALFSHPIASSTWQEAPVMVSVDDDDDEATTKHVLFVVASGSPNPYSCPHVDAHHVGQLCSDVSDCEPGALDCINGLCRCDTNASCAAYAVCTQSLDNDGLGQVCRSAVSTLVGLPGASVFEFAGSASDAFYRIPHEFTSHGYVALQAPNSLRHQPKVSASSSGRKRTAHDNGFPCIISSSADLTTTTTTTTTTRTTPTATTNTFTLSSTSASPDPSTDSSIFNRNSSESNDSSSLIVLIGVGVGLLMLIIGVVAVARLIVPRRRRYGASSSLADGQIRTSYTSSRTSRSAAYSYMHGGGNGASRSVSRSVSRVGGMYRRGDFSSPANDDPPALYSPLQAHLNASKKGVSPTTEDFYWIPQARLNAVASNEATFSPLPPSSLFNATKWAVGNDTDAPQTDITQSYLSVVGGGRGGGGGGGGGGEVMVVDGDNRHRRQLGRLPSASDLIQSMIKTHVKGLGDNNGVNDVMQSNINAKQEAGGEGGHYGRQDDLHSTPQSHFEAKSKAHGNDDAREDLIYSNLNAKRSVTYAEDVQHDVTQTNLRAMQSGASNADVSLPQSMLDSRHRRHQAEEDADDYYSPQQSLLQAANRYGYVGAKSIESSMSYNPPADTRKKKKLRKGDGVEIYEVTQSLLNAGFVGKEEETNRLRLRRARAAARLTAAIELLRLLQAAKAGKGDKKRCILIQKALFLDTLPDLLSINEDEELRRQRAACEATLGARRQRRPLDSTYSCVTLDDDEIQLRRNMADLDYELRRRRARALQQTSSYDFVPPLSNSDGDGGGVTDLLRAEAAVEELRRRVKLMDDDLEDNEPLLDEEEELKRRRRRRERAVAALRLYEGGGTPLNTHRGSVDEFEIEELRRRVRVTIAEEAELRRDGKRSLTKTKNVYLQRPHRR